MRFYELANDIEAGLWIVMGLGFLVYSFRAPAAVRRRCLVAAATLVLFGLSDVAEANVGTDVWWSPWWLLVWKVSGVAVLGILVWGYRQQRIRQRAAERT